MRDAGRFRDREVGCFQGGPSTRDSTPPCCCSTCGLYVRMFSAVSGMFLHETGTAASSHSSLQNEATASPFLVQNVQDPLFQTQLCAVGSHCSCCCGAHCTLLAGQAPCVVSVPRHGVLLNHWCRCLIEHLMPSRVTRCWFRRRVACFVITRCFLCRILLPVQSTCGGWSPDQVTCLTGAVLRELPLHVQQSQALRSEHYYYMQSVLIAYVCSDLQQLLRAALYA